MAEKSLRQQIEEFNKEIHRFEQDHKDDLFDHMNSLCDAINENTRFGEEYRGFVNDFHHWTMSRVQNMLQAETQEELDAYKDVFIASMSYLRNRLSITSQAMSMGKQPVQACLSLMTELCSRIDVAALPFDDNSVNQAKQRMNEKIKTCESQYQGNLSSIRSGITHLLLFDGNRVDFDKEKKTILENIKEQEFIDRDLFNINYLMGKCDNEVDAICEARKTYLPKDKSYIHYAKDYAWMALSIVALTTAVVFAVLLPALFIPVIILGGGVMVYSVFDFAKESSDKIMKSHYGRLGEKSLKPPSKVNKVIKGLTWTASGLGFGLAIVGLLAVIPGLAFPPIIPIIMAAAALVIIVPLVANAAYHHFKASRKIKITQKKCQQWIEHLQEDLGKTEQPVERIEEQSTISVFEKLLKQEEKPALTKADVAVLRSELEKVQQPPQSIPEPEIEKKIQPTSEKVSSTPKLTQSANDDETEDEDREGDATRPHV